MIEVHATADKPILTVVVPGNPGIDLFYKKFMALLAQKSPRFDIVCDSLRGFEEDEALAETSSDGELAGEHAFGLQDQINHFVKLVETRFDPSRHVSIVIMGHSVGAWIVQRVAMVLHRQGKPVGLVGLLTPTVQDISKSPRGVWFTQMDTRIGTYAPGIVFTAVRMANWVPGLVPFVASRVAQKGAMLPKTELGITTNAPVTDHDGANGGAYDAVMRYASSPRMVRQTVELAKEEMRAIAADSEPEEIAGFWEELPVFGFFAKNDHWVSEETRLALFAKYSDRANVDFVVDNVAHAFCLTDNEKVVDGLVADLVERGVLKQ